MPTPLNKGVQCRCVSVVFVSVFMLVLFVTFQLLCGNFQPDITAPGVDILAAWTAEDGPTRMTDHDKRVVKYNIFSGTSMSCPHVSAASVLLKAMHPTWTPAAIRSALMTSGKFSISI